MYKTLYKEKYNKHDECCYDPKNILQENYQLPNVKNNYDINNSLLMENCT